MRMKRIQSILFVLLLCFSMGARADNIIKVSTTEGSPDEEVTVNLSLQNSDNVSSLQVSIPLDDNLTLVEGSATKSDRCAHHALTVGVKDGVLNVLLYSTSMTAISDNSGVVASFKLKLGNQPKTISLTPSKLVLTNTSGETVSATSEAGSVTIRCAKAQYSTMEVDFGEVPIRSTYSRTVTVTNVGNADLTISGLNFSDVNVFSSTTTLPLTIHGGDSHQLNISYAPVERGTISKTLKIECNSVSKLNTIALKAQPFAVNELHVQPASGTSDEEVTIHLTMNNMDDICGLQIEFTLPDQLEYVDNSFQLSERKQDHVAATSLTGKVLRFIAYSMNNQAFTGSEGEIGSFKVKLVGRYGTTLTPTKTVFTATNSQLGNVVSDVYGANVSISSPQINTDSEINFGAVSVTEVCEKTFTIRNYGSAPLTINRIVFNNESLSVKETMPLVVPVYGTGNVTVVYNSLAQESFEATMQIYSNDPDLRLKEVTVKGSRYAPNFLTVGTPDIQADDNLSIVISASTYDDIAAIQFEVEYPSDCYEYFADNYTLTERTEGMTINQVNVNTLKVYCYFLGGGKISAGEGGLMTLQLKPIANVPEGAYQVKVKSIKMSTAQMIDKYAGNDIVSSFNVRDILLGDANGDGTVNMTDIVEMVNYILNKPSASFIQAAADVNKDGLVNVTDIVCTVSIIMSSGSSNVAPRRAEMASTFNDHLTLNTTEHSQKLALSLDNESDFVAAQFDVQLSDGQQIKNIQLNNRRSNGHALNWSMVDGNTCRVVVYSLSNKTFNGNAGELLQIELTGNGGNVVIDNITFVNSAMESKKFGALFGGTTAIQTMKSDEAEKVYYDLNGRQLQGKPTKKGLYIVNGRKVIVK